MKARTPFETHNSRGQSLVETALMLPILIMIVLNVVNFGYFLLIITHLTGAARTSTLYAIEGGATPAAGATPSSGGTNPGTTTGSVTYLTFQDLTGSLWNPTGVTVQVCSQSNINSSGAGVNLPPGGLLRTNCVACQNSAGGGCGAVGTNGAGFPVPNPDPEAPSFVLNRVDIQYTFTPLIAGQIFNIPLQAFSGICTSAGTCTFTRHAEMRAMN